MHDLRHAPRWSKTAVVVVLVVFGLILVVASVALWAFAEAARSSRQDARAEATRNTGTEIREVIEEDIGEFLEGVMLQARRRAPPEGPEPESGFAALYATRWFKEFLASPKYGPYVDAVFRVGPDGSVLWFRGRFRLAESPARIESEAKAQEERAASEEGREALRRARRQRAAGPREALPRWEEITRDYGLLTKSSTRDLVLPLGLRYAVQMVRLAVDALEARPDALDLGQVRRVVLRALEAKSLNLDRPELAGILLDTAVADLDRELESLIGKLPEEHASILRWEVDRYERTRARAIEVTRLGVLGPTVNKVRQRGKAGTPVLWEDVGDASRSQLIGIDYVSDSKPVLVVSFDLAQVRRAVEEILDEHEEAFHAFGMRVYLLRDFEDPELPEGRTPAVTAETKDRAGSYKLPFRLVADRERDPPGIGQGLAGIMSWAVIVLAVAGLGVGGRVLVRLLTREVRLAQLKADFVSNLSHELKTPITSISLFTEMLEDGKITAQADMDEAYSVLAAESSRLQGLVHRMIDVARGEARSTPYDLIPGDLNRPVLEATQRFRRIITEPGMTLDIQLHPEPLPMMMDPSSMDDVVTNLLSNAWKYKRGDKAVISVRTQRRGRRAILTVSDDGIGIPKAERRRVFEMFYRADQYLTQPVAGTGLGMALVRSVVAGHKGRVSLDAGPGGEGTTFRLRFPLAPRMALHLARENSESGSDSARDAVPHGKVEPAEGGVTQETEDNPDGAGPVEQAGTSQIRSGASNPGAKS